MHDTLVILAAGASSRMKLSKPVVGLTPEEIELANTSSKALMVFGNEGRPVLDWLLLNAEKAGYTKILLVVGQDAEGFKQHYGPLDHNNSFKSLSISYAYQHIQKGRTKPFGTADAVYQAMEQFPYLKQTEFTVCNSDNLYSVDVLLALRKSTHPNALIAYDREGLNFSEERIAKFAIIVLDSQGDLQDIIEKPNPNTISNYMDNHGKIRVSMNIFKFSGDEIFTSVRDCQPHPVRDEKELPSAILNYCNERSLGFKAINRHEHVPDLTSKEDILIIKHYISTHFSN